MTQNLLLIPNKFFVDLYSQNVFLCEPSEWCAADVLLENLVQIF